MKVLLFLMLLPVMAVAQSAADGRMIVNLAINYEPDKMGTDNEYYLIAKKPVGIKINLNQTFLLQSAWQKEGDSVVNIGQGVARIINDNNVELSATIYPGKKVRKGDMVIFLVPLEKPEKDTLFFKMARLDIGFTTISDSLFFQRDLMLIMPVIYETNLLLTEMAEDVRRTGEAMTAQKNDQDREITKGFYKGQRLFALMMKATAEDVLKFIKYVYARPDKYKAHNWKISETFATWAINGAM